MASLQQEPIDITTTPLFEASWKTLMKWPSDREKIVLRPIDHNELPDSPGPQTIYLVVNLPGAPSPFLPPPLPSDPTDLHWSLRWKTVFHHTLWYERIVQIERAAPTLRYLTNWGPVTKIYDNSRTLRVPVAETTAVQRRQLERIALTQPVRDPDGMWNCQQWVRDVLVRATVAECDALGQVVHLPIVGVQEVERALGSARNLKLE